MHFYNQIITKNLIFLNIKHLKNNFTKQSVQENGFDAKGRLEPGIRYKVGFGSAGEVKIKQAPK